MGHTIFIEYLEFALLTGRASGISLTYLQTREAGLQRDGQALHTIFMVSRESAAATGLLSMKSE